MSEKILPAMVAGNKVPAVIQSRFELAELMKNQKGPDGRSLAIETDEMNENDIRIVAGDEASRWDKPKNKDALIKEWNEAHS
jgi:hypothetical protein